MDKRIMNLSPAVKREYKKLYVAYKLDTNFVDIVFQKQRLRISINLKFSEINAVSYTHLTLPTKRIV